MNLFGSHEFGIQFHPYQTEALETLIQKHGRGEKRLHLVAPPGAGKTLMGLELARRLGEKTVILSPNTTIQHQWVDKFQKLTVDLSGLDQMFVHEQISCESEDQPMILSLTYQGFSVKDAESGGLHPNVYALYDTLKKEGYRTLILDECHHLLAHWGAAIQEFLEQAPETVVIGLTATPPVDKLARSEAQYLNLIGDIDFQIPLPAVVREGHLAPFQDLVYLVRPEPEETRFIADAHELLHELMQRLEGETEGPPLPLWAEEFLLQPQIRGQKLSRQKYLKSEPDQVIALVRYLHSKGIFPQGVSWLIEVEEDFSLSDQVTLLALYGREELSPESDLWQVLIDALSPMGYHWRQGQFVKTQGAVDKVLTLSAAKLRGVGAILETEMKHMGEDLKALVLTDFETTHAAGRSAAEGIWDPRAGGAVSVMRYLSAHPQFKALYPILVTGSNLLCSHELWPAFQRESERYFQERGISLDLETEALDGFLKISAQGAVWRSAFYLQMVTHFLELGLTQCLIGTRGLMAEGWDCPSLNTLIDLTAVTSYVSVNQIRGRTLRMTEQLKIANNWDIVAVIPELEGGFGDLDRFYKKHAHFYGVSDDGCIEKGVGHVHALFDHLERTALMRQMDLLNADMLKRAGNRGLTYEQWGIGQPYKNAEHPSLQVHLPELTHSRKLQGYLRTSPLLESKALIWHEQHANRFNKQQTNLLTAGVAFSVLSIMGGQWLLLAMVLIATTGAFALHQPIKQLITSDKEWAFLEGLASALLVTLQSEGLMSPTLTPEDIQLVSRGKEHVRVILPEPADVFIQSFYELLQPIQEQRYILKMSLVKGRSRRRWHGFVTLEKDAEDLWLPVPRLLGESRARADLFLEAIRRYVSPEAEVLYTKQGQGKDLMQTLFRHDLLKGRSKKLEIWQ